MKSLLLHLDRHRHRPQIGGWVWVNRNEIKYIIIGSESEMHFGSDLTGH